MGTLSEDFSAFSQNMARGYAGGKNEQRLVGAFSGRKRISKHIDEDQEIKSDTDDAAGEVLSGGDEEVGMVVPAPAVADGDEVLKSPRILSQPPILVSWYQLRCVSQELLHCSWGRGTSR